MGLFCFLVVRNLNKVKYFNKMKEFNVIDYYFVK